MLSSRNRVASGSRPLGRVAAAFVSTLAVAGVARAAGIEDTVGSAYGLGRSAYFARVNDFMATWQNPANLAVVPGGDLGIELRLPILQACFDRARDPMLLEEGKYKISDEESDLVYSEHFREVCNSAFPSPTGNIGWAQSFDSGWGYGIGLFTPAGVGNSTWGKDTVVSAQVDPDIQTLPFTPEGEESPTRQLGLERSAITAYVMAGLGWQPIKQLRVGASAGIGFGSVYNKSVVSVVGGTFTDQEILNELTVTDYAIPRANLGVVVSPSDWLDLFGTVTYQGDLHGKGNIQLTANGFKDAPLANCRDKDPGVRCKLEGVELVAPFQTYEATFGFRFAHPRNPRERVLEPMKDEFWDFEVDVNWAQTSHVDQFRIKVHNDTAPEDSDDPDERVPGIQFSSGEGDDEPSVSVPRQRNAIPKWWKDTWTFRAGGDINVIQDRLSIRAGGSFATRAVRPEFMNIDYMPVQKIGLHLGATLKFQERYKATVAYSHLFFEQIDVPLGTGRVREIVSVDPPRPLAVNEGNYRAALDVFSLQLNAQF